MGHFVSFPEAEGPERVERLVLNLVDPAVDAGAVGQLISLSLSPLDGGAAALFNSDPLIDYRSQRPLMNYKDGRLVDMRRSGIVLSHASDVEGQPFLHLHGAEPDFQWDALLADMIDIIERFGVKSTFSFTAVPSATPHTRPADMVVRTADKREDQVFEADFWFTAGFADYVEFHTAKLGISHTNVAVRVPVYLAGDRYFTGAAGALGLTSSLSGLYFPLGDLEQAAAEEVEAYSSAIEGNEELAQFIDKLEKDYDANGSVRGYVTAPKPEMRVPTVDEIGRAAEQFLAGVSSPRASASEKTFDPQGLLRKMERYQGFLPGEHGVGEGPAFDVSAMRGQQAGGGAEASERPAGDDGDSRDAAEKADDVAADAPEAEGSEGAAESVAESAEVSAVGESEADVADGDAEAAESEAGAADAFESEDADVVGSEGGAVDAFEPEDADVVGSEAGAADAVEGEAVAEAGFAAGLKGDEGFSAVSEETGDGPKDAAVADGAAESYVPAESGVPSETDDPRYRSDAAAGFGEAEAIRGESDLEADDESDLEAGDESDLREDASSLGDDLHGASKREDQKEAVQADVEADDAGEFGSAAEAEEGDAGDVRQREAHAIGEADLDGENDGLNEQTQSYEHVGVEASAAEADADAGLLITESEVIESMMGDSAEQPSDMEGVTAESAAEHVSVVDAALADSAMAGPPSEASSAEGPEAWERRSELEPPVSFDSVGSFESAGSFDPSGPLESSSAFEGPSGPPASGEGSPREFEGVSFTTGDGGQAVGYEPDPSEEGFIPSGVQGGDIDAWPVRGWDEALGFGRESDAVVPQEDANASHDIVFAPHVFGAALSAGDTPRHSALERMQTLVLKDSPEAEALAEASIEKAEQEAPAAEADDALAPGETAPDGAERTGENPESSGGDQSSGGTENGAAANGIGAAGDGEPGAAPVLSVPNEADPLGGVGADSVPSASLPASNVGQPPEPGQGQVKRRRGKHSA